MNTALIVYDCEIVRLIPDRKAPLIADMAYCNGWQDFKGMGIACICAVDVETGVSRAFFMDNLPEFATFSAGRLLVGHSNHGFDDNLLKAHGLWTAAGSYDLLRKLRKAVGEPEDYRPGVTKAGRKVNDCARVNLNGLQKSDDGANAPVLWQQGKYAEVVDYCLRDVAIEYQLFLRRGSFVDPVTGKIFALEEPTL